VIDTRASASELHVGDVITFRRPDNPTEMVTHRIAAIEDSPSGPQFVTKGDANSQPDPWRVRAAGDGWRMRWAVPYAGYVVGYLSAWLSGLGPGGALVIVLTVFALMAIWRTPTEPETTTTPAPAA
jgi:signal peptidase